MDRQQEFAEGFIARNTIDTNGIVVVGVNDIRVGEVLLERVDIGIGLQPDRSTWPYEEFRHTDESASQTAVRLRFPGMRAGCFPKPQPPPGPPAHVSSRSNSRLIELERLPASSSPHARACAVRAPALSAARPQ